MSPPGHGAIKLQGEISSGLSRKESRVTAAGPEGRAPLLDVLGWTPGVCPTGPGQWERGWAVYKHVNTLSMGRGHKTTRYMAR